VILSKGELIIKFKEEYINTTTLESNSAKFSCAQLQKKNLSKSVKKSISFFSHFANYKMRKIVKKHKSSYGKSTSRLGVITKNSSFQYMMVLEVDKYNDIKEITHQSAVGGTIVNSTDWYNTIFYGDGLSNGIYLAKRHEVESTVTLPDFLNINFYVWGRGTNASTGWSAANPNYQLGFCDVVDLNGNSATLRTFIYEVYTISGQSLGWYPTSASNVKFAYTTLGIGCPENRNITQTISPGTEAGNITYSASNSIAATNKIESGSDVVYTATNSITLSPGFKVEQGAVFNAYIGGCSSTGSLKSANISQDDNNVDSSEDNTFSIKLDSSTINQKTQNVKVYPNPNKGSFTTEILRAENNPYTLEIYNSNGVLVYKAQHLNTNKLHINQISMTDGVYYLRIICGTDISTEKIIVN